MGGKYAAYFDAGSEAEPTSHDLSTEVEPAIIGLDALDEPVTSNTSNTQADPHRQRWQSVSEGALEFLISERGRLAYLKRVFKQSYAGFDADTCTIKLDGKQLRGLDERFVQQFVERVGMLGHGVEIAA